MLTAVQLGRCVKEPVGRDIGASQVALVVNNMLANAGNMRCRFNPWVKKIPWRRAWQPTPVFLPGESHGQRSLEGYNPEGVKELDTMEAILHTCIRDTEKQNTCQSHFKNKPKRKTSILKGLWVPGWGNAWALEGRQVVHGNRSLRCSQSQLQHHPDCWHCSEAGPCS